MKGFVIITATAALLLAISSQSQARLLYHYQSMPKLKQHNDSFQIARPTRRASLVSNTYFTPASSITNTSCPGKGNSKIDDTTKVSLALALFGTKSGIQSSVDLC